MLDKEKSIRDRRDDEEIGSHHLSNVIREKRAPGLRGWAPTPDQVLRDSRLTNSDSELEEFAVDAWSAPQRVRLRHGPNQGPRTSAATVGRP